MLIPTLWLKIKTVFFHLKPHEVTTLHFSYEHVVYESIVASLPHNQAQFHFLYVRNAIFLGILVL